MRPYGVSGLARHRTGSHASFLAGPAHCQRVQNTTKTAIRCQACAMPDRGKRPKGELAASPQSKFTYVSVCLICPKGAWQTNPLRPMTLMSWQNTPIGLNRDEDMKTLILFTTVVSALALTGVANAQTAFGSLAINANVQGSMSLTFSTNANGLALTGNNTAAASLPFGTVSMFSNTVPANVTKTVNGTTSFDLSTPFDICVDKSNLPSTVFTLSAQLAVTDIVNIWTLTGAVGPTNISSGASFDVSSTGTYGVDLPHSLKITIPANSNGLISNTINFTVVAH
jgi:hypothetical protein